MLELRHLTKIYKTKGGEDVKALDDVSVRFKETGLVFLLGRSGSGKSTLLNLAGGLDEPTSGEVIVMGRSSKQFSGSDFDSYRNTYVGFVFQEYNVLNEFNVEDNVSLALELQGKTREKEKVKAILKEVDLAPFAKRKPNTLSGGQKQRIAIARALVKDPRIIMADEPTGALDSETGKQVFETLKRLSKTRLVLVVSHDREFAEEYGDRIIELKDGKILSDVSKTKQIPQTHGALTRIDGDTLAVRGELDETALKEINAFLRESGEVLLTRGKREIEHFKRANRIDENGARERFEATDETAIPKSDESASFIRSRLPMRKAFRIGASGLKLKPIRLIFTILLACTALIMFGLTSTMMLYNERSVLIESFMASDYEHLTLTKRYDMREYHKIYGADGKLYEELLYVSSNNTASFTPAEVKSFGEKAIGVISFQETPSHIEVESSHENYYIPSLLHATVLPEGHSLRNKIVAGNYPAANDEICVSDYFVECLKHATFFSSDENCNALGQKRIESANDLLGERLAVGGASFKVSGVFEAGAIPAKYDVLDRKIDHNSESYALLYEFREFLGEGMHALVFVTEETLGSLTDRYEYDNYRYFESAENGIQVSFDGNIFDSYYAFQVYGADQRQLPVYLFGDRTALADNELVLSFRTVADLMEKGLRQLVGEDWLSSEDGERLLAAINTIYTLTYAGSDDDSHVPTEEELAAHETIQEIYDAYPFSVVFSDAESGQPIEDAVLAGYYTGSGENNYGAYCSQKFFDSRDIYESYYRTETNYVPEPDAQFSEILIPFEKDRIVFSSLLDKLFVTDPATDVRYILSSGLYGEVHSISEAIELLSTVFLVIGLVFTVFASLLLFNFISMSIANKKKEIGILRAVGARGTDVFKIFISESGIIVGICTLISLVGSIILTYVLNSIIKGSLSVGTTLFVFGIPSVLFMLAVAVFVALIATFLPVYFAAKKKPVESIRAL